MPDGIDANVIEDRGQRPEQSRDAGRERTGAETIARQRSGTGPVPPPPPGPTGVLRAGVKAAAVLCLATAVVHVALVFLHVAPANVVSQRYSRLINAWVYPLFEQNWRLFAPDPESVNPQIEARTAHVAADGSVHVSAWFDLTAVDNAAVRHDPFPSHTAQNMLRRAWTSYAESHGGDGDDESRTDRAVMMQKYLRNVAVDRVAARRGGPFEHIQLRVLTWPVPAPAAAGGSRRTSVTAPRPADTRLLPWWKVAPDGN